MSEKNYDKYNRWRSITVSFRVSPEESQQINRLVHISGLTKQEYLIRKLMDTTVTVVGNPRIYKALRAEIGHILAELQRLSPGQDIHPELAELIHHVADVYNGLGAKAHGK